MATSADKKLLQSMSISLDRTHKLNAKLLRLEGPFLDACGNFSAERARRFAMMAGIVTPPVQSDAKADRKDMLEAIHDNIHLYNAAIDPENSTVPQRPQARARRKGTK